MVNMKGIAIGAAVILLLFVGFTYGVLKSGQLNHEKAKSDLGTELQSRYETLIRTAETALFSKELQTSVPVEYAKVREGFDASNRMYNEAKNNSNDPNATNQMNDAFIAVRETVNTMKIQVESVPNVNTDQITELNDVMVSSQRMVTSSRKKCNEIALNYNWYREMPPFSIVASVFGFEKIEYFKEDEGTQKMPELGLIKKN